MSNQIDFPSSPTLGQEFLADNGVTYTWLGNRWSGVESLINGKAQYSVDGGYSDDEYNTEFDKILDGGGA